MDGASELSRIKAWISWNTGCVWKAKGRVNLIT